jgi:hypothetical protein
MNSAEMEAKCYSKRFVITSSAVPSGHTELLTMASMVEKSGSPEAVQSFGLT